MVTFSDNKVNPYKENRVGKFSMATSLIEAGFDVSIFFKEMIIIRAEMLFYKKEIEYVAYSHLFDICDDACEPPDYKLEIKNGELIVTQEKYNPTYVDKRLSAIE